MEHLLSPRERRERTAEICAIPPTPWLGFDHDDHEYPLSNEIQEYPLIRGWTPRDVQELKLGNVGNRFPREALAMIQSWMFLGLLESVFGSRFRSNRFIVTTVDGQRTVQTGSLRTWINEYHSTNNLNPTSDIVQRNVQRRRLLTDSLTYAGFWNRRLVDMQREVNPPLANSEFFGPVHRLITLVAEALWAVAQCFPSLGERFFIDCDFAVSEENERDLRARLTRRGWCPSLYNKITALARTTSSFLEYVSLIPPLGDAPRRHRHCSAGECVEHNLDESTYRTKHKVEGCQCEMIGPPVEEVKKALHNQALPIIDAIALLELNHNEVVKPCSSNNSVKFVAFSHVWSDGLGSTTEEGIPKCQVEHLLDAALQAAGTNMFWIDSLCIPRERETRKRAISMMAQTYTWANATVVLDSGIRRCDAGLSLETKMIALSLSTWQERLWTLQESSLARRVVFMFQNGVVSANTIGDESSNKIHRPVIRTAQILLDNLSDWVQNSSVTVGGLQRNLYRRTSSRPDDESLAIAPFLNLDLAPLLDVRGEERMVRFWSQVRYVPRDIVLHNQPKITREGFGWAPRSIMNQKNAMMLDLRDQSAVVTPDGLKARYWLYVIQTFSPILLRGESLFYECQSDCCLRLMEHDAAPNLSLSRNDVVIFLDQLEPSEQAYAGVVLSQVPGRGNGGDGQTPMYKYGGLVGANLLSKATVLSISGWEPVWAHLVGSAVGQVRGEWAEVLIR